MIAGIMAVHASEAEVARDLDTVLEKVRQGMEVDNSAVAVPKAPLVSGRKISEVVAALEASDANAIIDDEFAHDVEARIKMHSEPWNPPSWD